MHFEPIGFWPWQQRDSVRSYAKRKTQPAGEKREAPYGLALTEEQLREDFSPSVRLGLLAK